MDETPMQRLRYTHWLNEKDNRVFLVVDVPVSGSDTFVLLELKEYREEQPRKFVTIPYSDWVTFTQEHKSLVPFTVRP